MTHAHETAPIHAELEALPEDEPGLSRRRLIRRSTLGLAGAGLTALLGGCGWGDDDDDDDEDTVGPDNESDGLEGAEDPGEDPGIDKESGIEEGVPGEDTDEAE